MVNTVKKNTLVYISALIPFGRIESFVLEEACEVNRLYRNFLIIPRDFSVEVFHQEAYQLVNQTIQLPLFSLSIVSFFLASLCSIRVWKIMFDIVRCSRTFMIGFKNFVVLPKALYCAHRLKNLDVQHIHSHWASTTATMAYIIHRMTGISYSFTMHRWDIYEDNMLKEKVKTASFARCISQKGKTDVLSIVGKEFERKVHVIHMGVKLPAKVDRLDKPNEPFVFITPANLITVKGHRYLIDACALLKVKGYHFNYWIIGDGDIENELKQMVQDKGLDNHISFLGRWPHEKVIQSYKDRRVDAVVLPSISCPNNESEGIPVALMEAMSYGIPVVSTDTGAIKELIGDGSGVMVADKNSLLLANAIEQLMVDREYYQRVSQQGREKVEKEFNIIHTTKRLVDLFSSIKFDLSYKRTIMSFLGFLLRVSGLTIFIREFVKKNKNTIIAYHNPDPEILRRHLVYLTQRYNLISLDVLVDAIETKDWSKIPTKSLVITLDDGLKENYALLNVLREFNIKPTIYLCSHIIYTNRKYWFLSGATNVQSLKTLSNDQRLLLLKESIGFEQEKQYEQRQSLNHPEILEMSQYVDFQSHTCFHPILTKCDDQECLEEIKRSKESLEHDLKRPIRHFAFPNGNYGAREIAYLSQCGYKSAVSMDHGTNDVNTLPLQLKRIALSDSSSVHELAGELTGIFAKLRKIV